MIINHKNSDKGFTLIEIMVTIAIVGIFASIALPSFARLIENNRINAATNELVSNLLLARSEALKRGTNVAICASTNQDTCSGSSHYSTGWIVFLDCETGTAATTGVRTSAAVDCDNDGVAGETEEILKVHDAFDSLYLKNNSANGISFTFSGRLAGNTTFDIGKSSSELKKEVVISRVGRVRSKKY